MDFELKKQKIIADELWREVSSQQNIETEITLPDYCGDIKRILKCVLCPGITNISLSGENASATGKVSLKLIYVNDKDKIDCYESSEDLATHAVVKNLPENPIMSAEAKTNYVNCRATSQRKISVEGNIAVLFKIYCRKETELIDKAQGNGVHCRDRQVVYENLVCRKEKIFDLGETAKVPQGKATIGKILCVTARATLESKKAVADKLLIKGELYTDVLYLCESEEGKTEKLTHSMPISQIVDIPGINENSLCSVILSVRQINVQRKADSSSQGTLLEIAAKCCAMVKCSELKTAEVSDDCYSTSHDIESEYTIQEFSVPVYSADEQKSIVSTIDMPSDVSSVLHIWSGDLAGKMKGKGDKAKADCSVVLCILYIDGKGMPAYAEKNIDFDINCKLKENYEHLRCFFDIQMRDIEWKITAKDKLEVKMKTGVIYNICNSESLRVLKDIKILAQKKNDDIAALTLYFGSKDENLWDIAKKYNTTKMAIQKENAIEGDVTENDGMILIPCIS